MGVFVHLASTYLLTMPNNIGFVPGHNKKRPDFRTFLQFSAKFSHNLHGNGRVSVARFHVLCSAICSLTILTERKSTTTAIASADRCKRRTILEQAVSTYDASTLRDANNVLNTPAHLRDAAAVFFRPRSLSSFCLLYYIIQVASARAMCYFTFHPDARITSSNSVNRPCSNDIPRRCRLRLIHLKLGLAHTSKPQRSYTRYGNMK